MRLVDRTFSNIDLFSIVDVFYPMMEYLVLISVHKFTLLVCSMQTLTMTRD